MSISAKGRAKGQTVCTLHYREHADRSFLLGTVLTRSQAVAKYRCEAYRFFILIGYAS